MSQGCPALFSYYGGKSHSVEAYPRPKFRTIVEPFAGGAAYSRRHQDRDVLLVERDPLVASVWRLLISGHPSEITRLPVLDAGQKVTDLDLPEPLMALLKLWINQGCARGPRAIETVSSFGARKWTPEKRKRVRESMEMVRHWRVIEGDYRLAPDIEATWFIDPPYNSPEGQQYKYHDIDYRELGDWCRSRKGQVIVCEQQGADWLDFGPVRNFRYQGNLTGEASREVVWLKGCDPDPQLDMFVSGQLASEEET